MTNSHSASADTEPARQHFVVDPAVDPRDVFMSAQDVHDYLGRGRTQGYLVTSDPAFQLYQAEPGRWRLCDVRRYYDDKVSAQAPGTGGTVASVVDAGTAHTSDTITKPKPARARRSLPVVSSDNPFLNSPRRSNAPGAKKGTTR
jgi:hypothetical protein